MSDLTEEEQITLESYDKLAEQWSSDHASYDQWQEDIQRFYQLLPAGRVLEVGCGSGRDARALINLGYEYVGTDISEGLLNEARKNNPLADFQNLSLYDLNFKDKFDGLWCLAVILHIPLPRLDAALTSITRNLKAGAICFITVKKGVGQKMEQDPKYLGDNRFFVYWSDVSFRKILKRYNFSVLEFIERKVSHHTTWLIYYARFDG